MNLSVPSTTPDTPLAGAVYSVDDGEGRYGIAKVLVVDQDGVHIRLYKNKFGERPFRVDVSSLDLGSIHGPDGFGMGHLPLTHAAFSAWEPVFLVATGVDDEELEGYFYWKEAQGGYFGGPAH